MKDEDGNAPVNRQHISSCVPAPPAVNIFTCRMPFCKENGKFHVLIFLSGILNAKSHNVIDVDDILSDNYMPGSLLVLENPTINGELLNVTGKGGSNSESLLNGTIIEAMATMGFHRWFIESHSSYVEFATRQELGRHDQVPGRELHLGWCKKLVETGNGARKKVVLRKQMMNEYLCRNFVAEQIVADMSTSRIRRRLGIPIGNTDTTKQPPRLSFQVKSNMLNDEGSRSYKDWLSKSTTLEDIYRHYETDLQKRDDNNGSDDDKDDDDKEEFDGHISGFAYQPPTTAPPKSSHSSGNYPYNGGGYGMIGQGGHGGTFRNGGVNFGHGPDLGQSGFGGVHSGYGGGYENAHSGYGNAFSSGHGGFGTGHGFGGVVHTFDSGYGQSQDDSYKYQGSSEKEKDLTDLFDIALTALAYLSFGMFIIHVVMCISAVHNNPSTLVTMMPMSMSPSASEPTGGGMTGDGMMGGDMTGDGGMTGTGNAGDMTGNGDMTGDGGDGMTGTGGMTGNGGDTGMTGNGGDMGGNGNGGDMGATGNGGNGGMTGNGGDMGTTGNGGNGGMTGNGGDMGATGNGGNGGMTGNGGDIGGTGNGGDMGATGNGDNGGVTGNGGDVGMTGNGSDMGMTGNGGITGNDGDTGMTGNGGNGDTTGNGADVGMNGDGGMTGNGGDGNGMNGNDGNGGMTGNGGDMTGNGVGGDTGMTGNGGDGGNGGMTGDGAATGNGDMGGITGDGSTGTGDGGDDGGRIQDSLNFRYRRDIPTINNPDNQALNELARRILTSIEASLIANEDDGVCLRKSLCENNKYSRTLNNKSKIWIPVWSLGMSWLAGRLTENISPATSMLDSLKASILGLGKANCDIMYQECDLAEERKKRRRRRKRSSKK